MPNITIAEVNDSVATLIAADALGYLKANTVAARLVNRNYEDQVQTRGQTVKIPFAGNLTVNDKAAGVNVQRQAPNDSSISVTLNRHKEVTFLLEDVARALATPDWLNVYTQDGMAKIAEAIDSDILGLYSGFSQTIDATSTSGSLTEPDIRNARRLLTSARVPMAGRFAILHEDAEYEFLGLEKVVNKDYAESLGQAAASAYGGRFMGFDFFVDQNAPVAAGQCKNLFGHRDAIVFVSRPLPTTSGMGVQQMVMAEDGVAVRVTMAYDKDALGLQVTIDTLYGCAELRDNHGVVISTSEM